MSLFSQLEFEVSVHDLVTLPVTAREIAFAGRSNAGKSSAINTLAQRKLAFVSKTPGRTQLLNFFRIYDGNYLVDLPGYGYAEVPESVRKHWQAVLAQYLETRAELAGLVLIMDIRHPLTPLDRQMLNWFGPTGRPIHILLTKADKLSKSQAGTVLREVRMVLQEAYPQCSVQLFSSLKKMGAEEAEAIIGNWLNASAEQ
ncbi:MAG: YihA family ribosome biogenesis GTP-binding protein [Burkholderiales bacterium]|nr:YihA family ribosome biogenesis GTP-binding protein [Burkholderiales bacterium]